MAWGAAYFSLRAGVLGIILALGACHSGTAHAQRRSAHERIHRQFVNSAKDYHVHMEAHVKRVEALGMEAIRRFPTRFPLLSAHPELRELARFHLRRHDQSKVNTTPEFLARYGLEHQRKIYQRLYAEYGVDFRSLEAQARDEAFRLRNQLNGVDQAITWELFHGEGTVQIGSQTLGMRDYLRRVLGPTLYARFYRDGALIPELRDELKMVETAGDQVDRGMDPVARTEEFGRTMQRGSEYTQDTRLKEMEIALENDYPSIVAGNTYEEHRARRCGMLGILGL